MRHIEKHTPTRIVKRKTVRETRTGRASKDAIDDKITQNVLYK